MTKNDIKDTAWSLVKIKSSNYVGLNVFIVINYWLLSENQPKLVS